MDPLAAPAPAPISAPAPADGGAATMPEGLPPQYWDASHGLKTGDLIKDFVGLKTSSDARTAARPEKPELYKAELHADFKLPEGVNIKFDDKDPIRGPALNEVRAILHEAGNDQATFSKLLTAHTKLEIAIKQAAEAEKQAAIQASLKRLGDNFEPRKTALDRHVSAALTGTEAAKTAKGKAIQEAFNNADAFEALEDFFAYGRSVIPGSQNNQDPPKPAQQRAADRWYPQKAS